jgi:beta-glucosidase
VELPGFRGGDRTRIDLPDAQQHLLERITALGKPTTLVLLNGSALATTWAQSNVPAIVEAWYPGQAGGAALADVLFGDYDPAGRLPVTVYRDTADLPPFASYAMEGRTYRFFRGTPLYAFGHGLSYTRFGYARLRTSAETVTPTHPVTVQVDVTNRGGRAGDEVVQLYARHPSSRVRRPLRELRGFQRVTLQPGETRTVSFPIAARALAYWDPAAHRWALEREPVVLEVGASSADIRLSRTIALDTAAGRRGEALRHRPEQSP